MNANYLDDRYGKYAIGADLHAGYPVTSFPISISNVPDDTVTFALWLVDYDAIPVSGFTWIHWNVADIPATVTEIPEDASRSGIVPMVQGNNSNAGSLVHETDPAITQHYVGPQPPNGDHSYTLTVFALDTKLNLKPGFWLNEARHAMAGHILAQTSVELRSRA
ncbi:Phospholipid-binding protein [Lacticaseibacillus saniviri JCM 17471 = DSM 24301]|uniref:Phospholipid-binding protein n=1 Tax=Lacticaseibacillus saniviri JCM 17471 = DSM 24301 TaxID=1293598 RepID=A0A0R2N355_9LACO|nr:Phospholipid-binding protein [Lacticaseibacillus saniviri JCM 17471 = DSM 24301]